MKKFPGIFLQTTLISCRKAFLASLCAFGLFFTAEVLATAEVSAGAGDAGPDTAGVGAPSGFVYDKEKYEGYAKNHVYRTLGAGGWEGVSWGIASDRGRMGTPPKEGELSSASFHAGGFSNDQLDEWFRRKTLPSIIFALTGVVKNEKYAAADWDSPPQNKARIFYITFLSGKYLGYIFGNNTTDEKLVANVFGKGGGLQSLNIRAISTEAEKKDKTTLIGPLRKYAFAQPQLLLPDRLLLDSFPKDCRLTEPLKDGDTPLTIIEKELELFYPGSPASERAEFIEIRVKHLFDSLSGSPLLLETARYFHHYKLMEEKLAERRTQGGGFASWDDEKKATYNKETTRVAHIVNPLQYYVFKYIQETISHALNPEGYPASPPCVEEENYHALMTLMREEFSSRGDSEGGHK
jgi:hypothetical protein